MSFQFDSTGILDWDIEVEDSRKILGIADEFIDLRSKLGTSTESQEIWFADSDAASEFIKACSAEYPQLYFSQILEEADQDWMYIWRQHYTTQEIDCGERKLLIVPEWIEPPEVDSLDTSTLVVRLQPGQAFGAGTHATTKLCLQTLVQSLERHKDIKQVQDFGTGTGILGITSLVFAHLTGRSLKAIGFEIESAARDLAKRNADLNAVAFPVQEKPGTNKSFDLTIANVLAPVLLEYRRYLWDSTNSKGTILLSGLLSEEAEAFADEFLKGYESRLEEQEILIEGDWAAIRIQSN